MKHIDSLQGGNGLAVSISQACGFSFCNLFAGGMSDCENERTWVLESGWAAAASGFPESPANLAQVRHKASTSRK